MKSLQTLRQDIPASIVVFFVAVPLCLGIALASGASAFSGLIAGIVGGLVVGSISRSALGVSGPAAGLAVIVLHAIEALGFEAFLFSVVLAGILQIVLGALRAGVLAYFFPSSVIRGMLSGIGVIICLKQIPHALGYDRDPEGELGFQQPDGETTFSELTRMFDAIEPSAVIVALVALAILLLWERVLAPRARFFRLVQGPLVAVTFGIFFQVLTAAFAPEYALASSHLVSVPIADDLAGFAQGFTLPDWGQAANPAVWITGLTIAIVASLETLLCLEATDKLDPAKRVTPANRELFAQGVGNVLSGLIGGLPITQVIVRSSANIQSGARSKLSAILHGALLLLSVFFLPRVLNLIPLSALAAVLLVVGYKLAKPALFVQMYAQGRSQFVPFVVTVGGIVLTDLLTGIALGMAVAITNLLLRNYQNSHFLHRVQTDEGDRLVVRLTLSEEVTFLNKGAILRELSRLPDGAHVTIDMSGCFSVDHDVVEVLQDFQGSAARRGIDIVFEGTPRTGGLALPTTAGS